MAAVEISLLMLPMLMVLMMLPTMMVLMGPRRNPADSCKAFPLLPSPSLLLCSSLTSLRVSAIYELCYLLYM